MHKDLLRDIYKKNRNNIDIVKISKCIVDKLFQDDKYISSSNILAYYPLRGEIDIKVVLNDKTIYLPFFEQLAIGEYKQGVRKIGDKYVEPLKKIDPSKVNIDLIIMPGIAFSREGTRLGYGKGWYDKFLGKNYKQVFKIGLCPYDHIISIINEDHDIKVNRIITEKEVIDME
jgi:5-formyltetrahydrofolate cyclo-ligase